jgi:hypothetical protein
MTGPAFLSPEEKLRRERERVFSGVDPHWADFRSLVDALQEEGKALAFLSTHARLAEKYSSPSFFLDQLRKWSGRLPPLPSEVGKIDPKRVEVDFLRSGERETVVLTFRSPGSDEFVRLIGTYFDGELGTVNITKGFSNPFLDRKNSFGDYDPNRGRKY